MYYKTLSIFSQLEITGIKKSAGRESPYTALLNFIYFFNISTISSGLATFP